MAKDRSWKEKLHASKDLPKVVPIPEKMQGRLGMGTLAIPSPLEIDALMRQVPEGRLASSTELRQAIAQKHHADAGCGLTTGIFTWIAANAAQEAEEMGETDTTPYWRTLKTGGEVNPKYPGGLERQRALLEAEGHSLITKGSKLIVANYQEKLMTAAELHSA